MRRKRPGRKDRAGVPRCAPSRSLATRRGAAGRRSSSPRSCSPAAAAAAAAAAAVAVAVAVAVVVAAAAGASPCSGCASAVSISFIVNSFSIQYIFFFKLDLLKLILGNRFVPASFPASFPACTAVSIDFQSRFQFICFVCLLRVRIRSSFPPFLSVGFSSWIISWADEVNPDSISHFLFTMKFKSARFGLGFWFFFLETLWISLGGYLPAESFKCNQV